METVIKTLDLSKSYEDIPILDHIELEIKKGEIVGLLGKNGAGKTTLLKLLAGLLDPTEGSVSVFSKNPWHERDIVLNRLGIMIETPVFYEHLTAYENIKIHLDYMGKKANISEVLNQVGLIGVENKPIRKFSMGMKQKLGIARAISHRPDVLLLDEPINGLDPVAIRNIRNLFLQLKKDGVTLLLSSHILGEMLQTAENLIVISNNKLTHLGNIADLEKTYGNKIENYLIERMGE